MINAPYWIPLIPLIAFILQTFWGKRLPRKGDWLPTSAIFISLLMSICVFFQVFKINDPYLVRRFSLDWLTLPGERVIETLKLGPYSLKMGLLVDNMTAVMLVVVSTVSFLVHLFSIGYMHGDERYSRYFAYLSLFSFSMLGLVLADNLLLIYVFWELVGLSSYLLIGFWHQKKSASNAAIKAFLTTRLGDVGMFIGILILFMHLGTFNFEEIFSAIAAGKIGGFWLTVAGLGVFMGAVGKSAQVPLHVWLPDAMEGPTPVSALIHAATMVAAGVYLVARTYLLYTPSAFIVIAYVGGITAFIAATIAVVQTDIKKVLAYSTISQLGYMILALGVGGYTAGMLHLTTHAFFKALLFLGSGSVIHAVHSQEMSDMGGLKNKMPVTFWTFIFATSSICGVPLFSGFYSKDMIIGDSLYFGLAHNKHLLLFLLGYITAGITAFYMVRLVCLTFFGKPRDQEKYNHAHESPLTMLIPLVILGVLTFQPFFSGYGHWFERLIRNPVRSEDINHNLQHIAHTISMWLSIIIVIAGIGISLGFYYFKKWSPGKAAEKYPSIYRFLVNKWYFDEIYSNWIINPVITLSKRLGIFDLDVIDYMVNAIGRRFTRISFAAGEIDLEIVDRVVNNIADYTGKIGKSLRKIQTGQLQHYMLVILFGVLGFFLLKIL